MKQWIPDVCNSLKGGMSKPYEIHRKLFYVYGEAVF